VRALDLFSLDDKVAIVTGAAGLLGRQHARALAEAGASVVLVDRDPAVMDIAADLARAGTEALGELVDIGAKADLIRLTQQIVRRFERLDVLVNNAAINEQVEGPVRGAPIPFEELPLATWQRSIDVNVTGMFLCCQTLGAEMARRGHGSIINIASTYGVVAPDQALYVDDEGRQTMYKSAAYSTTKGAVIALTRYLAAYWGHRNVRVNTLSPGGVENGQDASFVRRYAAKTPLGRMAQPNEYHGTIVFLASEASAYLTGANVVVDGGFTTW